MDDTSDSIETSNDADDLTTPNSSEDEWTEGEAETPAGVTDSMLTPPDFVSDSERQEIYNVAPGEENDDEDNDDELANGENLQMVKASGSKNVKKRSRSRAISKPSKLDEEEAPTTSSDILSDEPGPMEQETIPAEELEHSQNCSSCELLKKENKRIRSCWQTSKQKLSAVREELRALRSVTGESSHAQVLDDDVESDNEECSVSGDGAEEPSDEVSDDVEIETETETTDTDTDEDINVPPQSNSV
ncbi:uncharacterized protein LOC114536370 [Dendronephthya gigantea]|uniref:uncharacterized protein LOC114536370 n=1 Tax=Dendronephthya gigantea TaxID=151771 RepID=UPI00106BC732|nr:uncharacterized protein LOC114536370 [Dendronephthya gigantea]